jgi:hypothetical protein
MIPPIDVMGGSLEEMMTFGRRVLVDGYCVGCVYKSMPVSNEVIINREWQIQVDKLKEARRQSLAKHPDHKLPPIDKEMVLTVHGIHEREYIVQDSPYFVLRELGDKELNKNIEQLTKADAIYIGLLSQVCNAAKLTLSHNYFSVLHKQSAKENSLYLYRNILSMLLERQAFINAKHQYYFVYYDQRLAHLYCRQHKIRDEFIIDFIRHPVMFKWDNNSNFIYEAVPKCIKNEEEGRYQMVCDGEQVIHRPLYLHSTCNISLKYAVTDNPDKPTLLPCSDIISEEEAENIWQMLCSSFYDTAMTVAHGLLSPLKHKFR